ERLEKSLNNITGWSREGRARGNPGRGTFQFQTSNQGWRWLDVVVVILSASSGFAKLVHGYRRLALAQTDDVLCLHIDLSVPRIARHFFPDPTGEVEFLIHVLQLNLCKHYTI